MKGSMSKDEPDPQTAALLAIAKTMEKLQARLDAAGATDNGELISRLSDALEGLSETQKAIAAQSDAVQRQIHRPRNEHPPMISAYNPRGDKDFPRPNLKCEIMAPWFRPWDAESLNREEVELLNLLEPGKYLIKRTDGTRVELVCTGIKNLEDSGWTRLTVAHPTAFRQEEHQLMPALSDTLRAMYATKPALKKKATDILTMEEEEAMILDGQLTVSVGA